MTLLNVEDFSDEFTDLALNHDKRIHKKLIMEGFTDIKPSSGDIVCVHYVATYHGGERHGWQFDSSRCREEPLEFVVGKGEVIEIFSRCVVTMKLGEICEFIVPSECGFPVNQELKFTIELLDVRGREISLESTEPVLMSVVEEGLGDLVPVHGAQVEIAYRQLRCQPAEKLQNVTYIIGNGIDAGVPDCLDVAVLHMKKGGRALVRQYKCSDSMVHSSRKMKFAFYEIHLVSFDETIGVRPCSKFESEFAQVTNLKASANDRFKKGDYLTAISTYEMLDQQIQQLSPVNSEWNIPLSKLQADIRLNLALACLKVNRAVRCDELCRKVLDVDSSNIKALFRLGQVK